MRLFTIFLCGALSADAYAENFAEMSAEGTALISPFQQHLMDTVRSAMQVGGATKAVEACQLLAPEIADQHSRAPWVVGRTALKVRNPANAPDAWEKQILEQFVRRAAAGEGLSQLTHSEIVKGEFRMMKAIPTGEACLGCHGREIKPELAAVIDQRYPQDKARGFAPGELRGAFTLRRMTGVENNAEYQK